MKFKLQMQVIISILYYLVMKHYKKVVYMNTDMILKS